MRRRLFIFIGLALLLGIMLASATVSLAQVTLPTSQTIGVTYQVFYHGWMLWRSDSGEIYVFMDDGRFMRFRSEEYGALPWNPMARYYDYSKLVPVMGFGQVWGNFPDVRMALGDARMYEWNYTTEIFELTPYVFELNAYEGSRLQVIGTQWSYLSRTAAFTPTPTMPPYATSIPTLEPIQNSVTLSTYAAYQLYEQGFMIWRADTQDILVFHGSTGGDFTVYPYTYYAAGDENTPQIPPEGLINPINGFGRVWGNFAREHQLLGWARTTETAYEALVTTTNGSYLHGTITGPDGTLIYLNGGNWSY
ncbi:MAG: hypothetical protein U0670_19235 [Anaerolineae bacterium]